MPSPQIAVVEKMFSAFAAKDLDAAVSTVSEDTLWIHHGTQKLPSMRFVGKSGVRQFFEINFNTMSVTYFNVSEIIQNANLVIAFGNEEFTMAGRDDALAQKWVQIYTVENGLITRMEEFATSADEKSYLVVQ
ncbi:nuclear transport factor 2 family protein [Lysobacter sp. yr284]|uniref:nuclear transport factor 2 family protein n=1 Tax=Lysobacter sp. yr284 TaxID=1761791 RepID=UPI000B887630|nr:nuclear transport factor 2 family protein [Lysobacter sp. yr284]